MYILSANRDLTRHSYFCKNRVSSGNFIDSFTKVNCYHSQIVLGQYCNIIVTTQYQDMRYLANITYTAYAEY